MKLTLVEFLCFIFSHTDTQEEKKVEANKAGDRMKLCKKMAVVSKRNAVTSTLVVVLLVLLSVLSLETVQAFEEDQCIQENGNSTGCQDGTCDSCLESVPPLFLLLGLGGSNSTTTTKGGCNCLSCECLVCDFDPTCCNENGTQGWDSTCANIAQSLCTDCPPLPLSSCDSLGGTAASCAEESCDSCLTVRPNASGCACSECACAVCQQDSFCCTTAWDLFCVKLAEDLCDSSCGTTENPTASPLTSSPTASPSTSVPTTSPTELPTLEPTSSVPPPTGTPTQNPTVVPTVVPTQSPADTPTAAPTQSPTSSLTAAPTPVDGCTDRDIDVCIALDVSGSICSVG